MTHQVLFPQPSYVTVSGRKVEIRPVAFKDFESFGRAAGMVLAMAGSKTAEEVFVYASRIGAIEPILVSATSLSKRQISKLPGVVVIQLMFEVIRVNKSFFEQALVSAESALAGAQLPSD